MIKSAGTRLDVSRERRPRGGCLTCSHVTYGEPSLHLSWVLNSASLEIRQLNPSDRSRFGKDERQGYAVGSHTGVAPVSPRLLSPADPWEDNQPADGQHSVKLEQHPRTRLTTGSRAKGRRELVEHTGS